MGCHTGGCKKPPIALYTWGLYPDGEHNKRVAFCKECADELWSKINDPVKALLMHFVIEPLETVVEEQVKITVTDVPQKKVDPAEVAKALGAESYIKYEDFAKADIRVATVIAAEPVQGADKLLKLTVDAGDPAPRIIVAGIRLAYAPETLIGTQITIIANLEPRKLRGITSQGMLLAASDESGLALIRPDKTVKPGSSAK